MKRLFALISVMILLPGAACLAKDVKFEIAVSRTKAAVGQSIQLNFTFDNTQNFPAFRLPLMDGFTSRYVGPSTSMSIINGVASSSVTHMYILQAVKTGTFTIGAFAFDHNGDRYISNQVTVEVVDASAQSQADAQPNSPQADIDQDLSDRVFVVMETAKNNPYVYEPIPLSVKLYVRNLSVRDVQFPHISCEGFSLGQFSQPRQYQDVVAGAEYDVIEFQTNIFGLRPGEFKIGPAALQCNLIVQKQNRRRPSSRADDDFFGQDIFDNFFGGLETRPLTLNSRSLPVTVQPLPEEGKPADFTGAIGDLSFNVSISPIVVKVGDPITLKLTVKGKGNMSTVKIPAMQTTKDFKVYEPQIKQEEDLKILEQVIMPMHADIRLVPAIAFSFFNTQKGTYETIPRGPFAISVAKPDKEEQAKIVEGNQIQNLQVPSEEKFGRDIIFIKESEGYLEKKGAFLFKDVIFLWFQILVLFAYLCVVWFYSWGKRLRADIQYARKLQAPGKARSGIAKAKKLLKEQKNREFYDVVFDTLQGYMGDRFQLSSKAITAGIIDDILKPRNVSRDILDKVNNIFKDCDMARYAPGGFAPDQMQSALADLEEIIDYFQRNKV